MILILLLRWMDCLWEAPLGTSGGTGELRMPSVLRLANYSSLWTTHSINGLGKNGLMFSFNLELSMQKADQGQPV